MMRLRAVRMTILILVYSAAIVGTLWLAYLLRFDFAVPADRLAALPTNLVWILPVKLLCLFAFGQLENSLSYFSHRDVRRIVCACLLASLVIFAVHLIFGIEAAPSRGIILTDGVLSCAFLYLGRSAARFLRERYLAPQTRPRDSARRVGVVGAGEAGAALVRELIANRWMGLRPLCFFDDRRRAGARLHGVPVWGPPELLEDPKIGLKLDEVIIALPGAETARLREVVKILLKAGVPFRTVPSKTELTMGTGEVAGLRPVHVGDLLGCDQPQIDIAPIREMIAGRTVLITGAGGSIGSELCRQVAALAPRSLVMVERSEAALFPIEQELIERGFHHFIAPAIADVTDRPAMRRLFAQHHPQVVFHSAAHKHVAMMESQPAEAIRNNVLGTANVARLASEHAAERCVLVSSDKAVNPTNVIGATRRLAEIALQAIGGRQSGTTRFATVRFGNVLGSSGSVVPIFARQIAAGGPVKVTHPEVARFFMTLPEASSLVLQCAAQSTGGEIFALDAGKSVKIVHLARQMIELSGLRVGTDIRIEFTGLRPGEKLDEEPAGAGESADATTRPRIRQVPAAAVSFAEVENTLTELATAISRDEPDALKRLLQRFVPEYRPEFSAPAASAHLTGEELQRRSEERLARAIAKWDAEFRPAPSREPTPAPPPRVVLPDAEVRHDPRQKDTAS